MLTFRVQKFQLDLKIWIWCSKILQEIINFHNYNYDSYFVHALRHLPYLPLYFIFLDHLGLKVKNVKSSHRDYRLLHWKPLLFCFP